MSRTSQEIIEHQVRKQIRRETPINIVEIDNQRLGVNHQDFLTRLTAKCIEDGLDINDFTRSSSIGDIVFPISEE